MLFNGISTQQCYHEVVYTKNHYVNCMCFHFCSKQLCYKYFVFQLGLSKIHTYLIYSFNYGLKLWKLPQVVRKNDFKIRCYQRKAIFKSGWLYDWQVFGLRNISAAQQFLSHDKYESFKAHSRRAGTLIKWKYIIHMGHLWKNCN